MSDTTAGSFSLSKHARLLHEVAFSAYLSLLAVTENTVRSAQHPSTRSWVESLQSIVAQTHFTISYRFGRVVLCCLSAMVLLLFLRLTDRFRIMTPLLRAFGGFVAVVGLPLIAGYVSFVGYLHMFDSFSRALLYVYAPYNWLTFEVLIVIFWVSYCIFREHVPPARWDCLVIVVHFALWTYVGLNGNRSELTTLGIFGGFASLAWIHYLRVASAAN